MDWECEKINCSQCGRKVNKVVKLVDGRQLCDKCYIHYLENELYKTRKFIISLIPEEEKEKIENNGVNCFNDYLIYFTRTNRYQLIKMENFRGE